MNSSTVIDPTVFPISSSGRSSSDLNRMQQTPASSFLPVFLYASRNSGVMPIR